MGSNGKTVVVDGQAFDLEKFRWDHERFADHLAAMARIELDAARGISRQVRDDLMRTEAAEVPAEAVERMVEARLMVAGGTLPHPYRFDRTVLAAKDLQLSPNALRVLERRYLKKDDRDRVMETPEDMFRRVARHIAQAERRYGGEDRLREVEERFYRMMTGLQFLPNSPTLMNAGRQLGQLAACFVLPVDDSMEGIFDSLKNAALIHKSGGGTGFSFSRLRPKDSRVGTTGGVASGPVSFMRIFNTATEQVKQGGTRRGANMAILRVDHPDILEFIHCKRGNGELNNFNISVALTDVFMTAVARKGPYDLIDPRHRRKVGELDAGEVYDALVAQAWENGDPGIIFIDRINRDNPTPRLGAIESTNPCGEQPLLPLEACNLGSLNLAAFVDRTGEQVTVDWPALEEAVRWAVRFLDNTIDMSRYPLPEITAMVHGNRKIGLGVMGFADLLFHLRLPYDSEAALGMAEEVMRFVQQRAVAASQDLAAERGAFPNYPGSVFAERDETPRRNATTTTIAPTGTLSIIAGCSSGVEPLFALSFVRTVMDGDRLVEVNPVFADVAHQEGFHSPELMETIASRGSIRDLTDIPEWVRRVFVTAHDISPEWHIRMQAAFQTHTENAVSKTVNLPRTAGVEDVRRIYDLAFELGCKGVTIYRDGSKQGQVLAVNAGGAPAERFAGIVKKRPDTLNGFTTRIATGMGQLYLTVTEYEGRPFEVFATIGKSGRSTTAKTEAIGRLVSLALRSGVTVEKIVDQLKGIGGEYPVFQEGGLVLSIPDAIARVLEKRYLADTPKGAIHKTRNSLLGETCPECGQTISFEEGCMTCHFCGFTKCG